MGYRMGMAWLWLASFIVGCKKTSTFPEGVDQLNSEVIAARDHINQLEEQLLNCTADVAPNTVFPELKQVFQDQDVEVGKEGTSTRLVVRLSHIFADPYALKFRAESDQTVDLLATAFDHKPDYAVTIVGHTSDRPIPPRWAKVYTSNMDWSTRLAGAMIDRFVTEFNCDPARFTVAGRGPYSPVESNDLESGRDANQRLEIWMYPGSLAAPPSLGAGDGGAGAPTDPD